MASPQKKQKCAFGASCKVAMIPESDKKPEDKQHMHDFWHCPKVCFNLKCQGFPTCKRTHWQDNTDVLCKLDLLCTDPACELLHGWKCKYGDHCNRDGCILWHTGEKSPHTDEKPEEYFKYEAPAHSKVAKKIEYRGTRKTPAKQTPIAKQTPVAKKELAKNTVSTVTKTTATPIAKKESTKEIPVSVNTGIPCVKTAAEIAAKIAIDELAAKYEAKIKPIANVALNASPAEQKMDSAIEDLIAKANAEKAAIVEKKKDRKKAKVAKKAKAKAEKEAMEAKTKDIVVAVVKDAKSDTLANAIATAINDAITDITSDANVDAIAAGIIESTTTTTTTTTLTTDEEKATLPIADTPTSTSAKNPLDMFDNIKEYITDIDKSLKGIQYMFELQQKYKMTSSVVDPKYSLSELMDILKNFQSHLVAAIIDENSNN